MERPRQTKSALKRGLQTANDSVSYYAFGLTSSWIGAWNSSTRWRLSWHLARRCLSTQRMRRKQSKNTSCFTKSSVFPPSFVLHLSVMVTTSPRNVDVITLNTNIISLVCVNR
jgi:hypothetical protein